MTPRPYDFIIYGATGYTAQIAIDYLIATPAVGAGHAWAIAGRSAERLGAVLDARAEALAKAGIARPAVIVASVDDAASLDAMCSQATVLMAMAGPYALCGLPVVAACVRNGTHYVDITGEYQFIRRAIEAHHAEAEAKGVAIVTTCGFDCVPSDVGALMVHEHVAAASGGSDTVVEMAAYFSLKGAGRPSGGTAVSALTMMKTATSADRTGLSLVPFALRAGIPTPMQRFVGFAPSVQRYTAPFIMAAGNERIVRYSNVLLGRPTTSYWEAAATRSLTEAVALFVGVVAIGVFMFVPPLRFITSRYLLPKQGAGPSEASKAGNAYTATFVATTKAGKTYKGVFVDGRNPYDSTGVFVVEAAATLVAMAKAGKVRGGVITPAAAFGPRYLERLTSGCGITASVEEVSKSK